MLRRVFCKLLLVAVIVFGLFVHSDLLLAQGRSEEALERAMEVQEKHTDALMARPGVVGTAVGLNAVGRHVVMVLLEKGDVPGIPQELEGIPVKLMVTGEIHALTDPTARFSRPVPIGVSTGNEGECSAGTIGCRVKDADNNVYALSNNHVYALENNAPLDSLVLQPGRYDVNPQCEIYPVDVIGTLFYYEPIVFHPRANNTIDAAIASTTIDDVDNTTPDGEYTPSAITVEAYVGQPVQKYGRTTSLTHGTVDGINANVRVRYSNGQAGFVDQILITPGTFSDRGDSGSVIVTDDYACNPIGLLFAGSSSVTIANPINAVLDAFDVTIDGEEGPPPPPPATGGISGTVTEEGSTTPISGAAVSVDTGQSTTTATDGTYTITDVPIGNRLVTASASGFVSQEKTVTVTDGETSIIDFSLDPAVTGDTVSVVSIDYATEGGKGGTKHLLITVALEDDLGGLVEGASVSIKLDNTTTNQSWTGTGVTGTDGTVTFSLKNAPSGHYTTDVTDVSASGLTWDPKTTPPNGYDKP